MLKPLLIGIGIGGIIFTKKGKDLINNHINSLKDYVITNVSNTEIVKIGKEFLDGYNNLKEENTDNNELKDKNNITDDSNKKPIKKEKDISKKY